MCLYKMVWTQMVGLLIIVNITIWKTEKVPLTSSSVSLPAVRDVSSPLPLALGKIAI